MQGGCKGVQHTPSHRKPIWQKSRKKCSGKNLNVSKFREFSERKRNVWEMLQCQFNTSNMCINILSLHHCKIKMMVESKLILQPLFCTERIADEATLMKHLISVSWHRALYWIHTSPFWQVTYTSHVSISL